LEQHHNLFIKQINQKEDQLQQVVFLVVAEVVVDKLLEQELLQ
jgi:hypothetical protein